ncbi:MAG: hypothetical protein UZ03_NOB001000788 [Nitrospira sp. OLB3]|nr:MAG: hypothetical protein UZ03_NOB001000788 [Nitrospira sp. OLB3]
MKQRRSISICCVCNAVWEDRSAQGTPFESWNTLTGYLQAHRLSSGDYHLTDSYCPTCSAQVSKLSRRRLPVTASISLSL